MCVCGSPVGMHLHECMTRWSSSVYVKWLVFLVFGVKPVDSWLMVEMKKEAPCLWQFFCFFQPCVFSLLGTALIFIHCDFFFGSFPALGRIAHLILVWPQTAPHRGMKGYLIHDLSSKPCQLSESAVVSTQSRHKNNIPIRYGEIKSLDLSPLFWSLYISLSEISSMHGQFYPKQFSDYTERCDLNDLSVTNSSPRDPMPCVL